MTNPEVPTNPDGGRHDKVDFTGVEWKSVEWTNICLLYLRACESKLAQPILGDDMAARDVERIDYDFTRIRRVVRPEINQFMVALRSAQFDGLIKDYLHRNPDAVVLHLGCGLHSRAFRMAPENSPWFDIDLPNVIALRRQLYSDSETYRMIGSSVTEPAWIDELPTGGPVLVVAEGLLMYISPAEVASLLNRILDRFDTGEVIADLLSKWAPRFSKVLTSGLIEWGTGDGLEIARWEPRLRLVSDSPIMAGVEKIPLALPRALYRAQFAFPVIRNYDRIFQYTF